MKYISSAFIFYPSVLDKVSTYQLKDSGKSIKAHCPNVLTEGRYKTIYIKEPETIEWLDNLRSDDILWDIGANIGLYSLYPAITRDIKVVAIEPGLQNYVTLTQNISLNKLENLITPIYAALSSATGVERLYLKSIDSGGAQNSLFEPKNDHGMEYVPQGIADVLKFRGDDLISMFGLEFPTAMKIDVDGHEIPLLEGMSTILKSEALKKISIELATSNIEKTKMANEIIESFGFKLQSSRRSQFICPNSDVKNFHYARN